MVFMLPGYTDSRILAVSASWSEDIWQSITQAVPVIKRERFKLSVQSLLMVMQNVNLDVADDPDGKYPPKSLQATVRRWNQDETLRRLISVFEELGLSKDWPSTLSLDAVTRGHLGLRNLIIRTLLEIRNLQVPKERVSLTIRSEEEWQRIFSELPELGDSERSRFILSNLDAYMRNPECRWRDLEEANSNRINSAINDLERRKLLATIVRKLTCQGLTSSWVETFLVDRTTKRSKIRNILVQHLRRARKLAAARIQREQESKTKKPFTWKSKAKTVKGKSSKQAATSTKAAIAHAIVNHAPLPEGQAKFIVPQITTEVVEMWRARKALRKSKSNSSLPISRRERERLKQMQRPTR